MTMLKFWLTENSFECVQLEDVSSFDVVRKENEIIIEMEITRELGNRYRRNAYLSRIYLSEDCQDEKMAKLTNFLDEAFKSNTLLIEIPNIYFESV